MSAHHPLLPLLTLVHLDRRQEEEGGGMTHQTSPLQESPHQGVLVTLTKGGNPLILALQDKGGKDMTPLAQI